MSDTAFPVISALDAPVGALFLLTALGMVATRQVLASLQLFILQSLLLTLSASLLGIASGSVHLFAVAVTTIATKTLMIPWLLRHTVHAEVYRAREIKRVLNIPTSRLMCAGLIVLAYVIAMRPASQCVRGDADTKARGGDWCVRRLWRCLRAELRHCRWR